MDITAATADDVGMARVSSGLSGRWMRAVAWGLVAVDGAVLFLGAALMATTGFEVAFYLGAGPGAAGLAGVGALVVSRKAPARVGWLLLAVGTGVSFMLALRQAAWIVWAAVDGSLVLVRQLILWADVGFFVMMLCLLLLFLVFPDGQLPSRRWRPVVVMLVGVSLTGIGALVPGTASIVDPAAHLTGTSMTGDAGVAAGVEPVLRLFDVVAGVQLVVFVLSVVSLVIRLRRADDDQRRRIKWVVYTGVAWLVLIPFTVAQRAASPMMQSLQDLLGGLAFVLLAAGFGIALFRHKLWDIDVVVRRSAVYAVLWLTIAGVYAGVAAGLGLAVGARLPLELAVLLTVLATLVFQPARRWLERAADRWVFGRRGSPLEAVHGFGALIDTADRAGDVAGHLATATVSAGLAWAEADVDGSPPAREGADSGEPTKCVAIAHGGTTFGRLRCQAHVGRTLTDEDEAMLAALAAQAGLAISHARLASRLVHAHESERRRIERNLHDGAQQELIGLAAQLGLARAQVDGDAATRKVLDALDQEIREILSNLRNLAQGIHPTVLSDGGIVAAVEDRCSRLPIEVTLAVDPSLRDCRFTDDVEGAVFFFVVEGLTNVLKHSTAAAVEVRLGFDQTVITAEVADDGDGFDPEQAQERGLGGLADRLHALGGTLSVVSSPGSGTRLTATLPAVPVTTSPA